MRMRDADRRIANAATIAASAGGTGGVLELKITLYDDGHSSMRAMTPGSPPLNCGTDLGLMAELAYVIRNARRTRERLVRTTTVEPTDTDGDTSRWNENGEASEADNDRHASRAYQD